MTRPVDTIAPLAFRVGAEIWSIRRSRQQATYALRSIVRGTVRQAAKIVEEVS